MKKKILATAIGLLVVGGGVYFGHPHNYKETVIAEPTCTTEGTLQYQCWCGNNYTEQPEALGHNYKSEITVEATCTENGVKIFTCTVCEDTYTEEIEALGHELSTDTKEATCEEFGYEKNVCSRCDYTQEEVFEALGHNYQLTEESKTEKVYVCNICEDSYTEKVKTKPQQPAPAQPDNSSASTGGGYSEAQRQADLQKLAELGAITGVEQTGKSYVDYTDPNAAEKAGIDLSGVTLH